MISSQSAILWILVARNAWCLPVSIPSALGQAPRLAGPGPNASDQSNALAELRIPALVTLLIPIFHLDCL